MLPAIPLEFHIQLWSQVEVNQTKFSLVVLINVLIFLRTSKVYILLRVEMFNIHLSWIRRFFPQSKSFITRGGWTVLELKAVQAKKHWTAASHHKLYYPLVTFKVVIVIYTIFIKHLRFVLAWSELWNLLLPKCQTSHISLRSQSKKQLD